MNLYESTNEYEVIRLKDRTEWLDRRQKKDRWIRRFGTDRKKPLENQGSALGRQSRCNQTRNLISSNRIWHES